MKAYKANIDILDLHISRKNNKVDYIEAVIKSIKEEGLKRPLIVKRVNNKFEILLGGTISDFNYFPYSINASNIESIMKSYSSTQRSQQGYITRKEHSHSVEITHDHAHDLDTEMEHRHGIDEENIPEQYYME